MFISLPIFAIVTSIISAIIGMGGGILLLAIMTFFLPIQLAIPIHGIVQLVSNSSRVYLLRKHVRWKFFKYFVVGLPIGASLSTVLLMKLLEKEHIYILLVSLIAYALFKPKKLPELKVKPPLWIFIGIGTGISAILVGAVGPLIAPFFLRSDFTKEEIISTKAVMQTSAHLIKIPAFLFLEFNYSEYISLTVLMGISAIIGTKLGVLVLDKVDNKLFLILYKLFLGIAGLRILYKLML